MGEYVLLGLIHDSPKITLMALNIDGESFMGL